MTTLHLVRHGQSTWNAEVRIQGSSNPELSPLGVQQAQEAGSTLPAFDRIYSSDLLRTRQTTEHLLGGNTDQVDFRPSLREIHLGPWEGMLLDDAIEKYPEQTDFFRNKPQQFSLVGAETFQQLQRRAINAINEILVECDNQNCQVLVVSHGAFLKSLLISYENKSLNDMWKDPHIDNCGHSIVEYGSGTPKIVKFAGHLEW